MTHKEAERKFINEVAAELNVPAQAVEGVIYGDTTFNDEKQRDAITKRFGNDGRGVFICTVWKGSASPTTARHMPRYDYFGQILEGVNLYLHEVSYTLQLFVATSRIVEQDYFEQILANRPNAGLIHLTSAVSEYVLRACQNHNRPIVFLDYPVAEDPSDQYLISMKSETAIEEAVTYLYSLGHRRIAYIQGPMTKQTEVDRFKGYVTGLTKLGLAIDDSLIGAGNWHERTGKRAVEKFLALKWSPTGIIAANDLMAFGAMAAVQEKGLKIPDDISVIGFDDLALASMSHPPLTSVRTPMTQMGITAGEYIVSLLEGKTPHPRHVYFPLELIIRESTGAAPR